MMVSFHRVSLAEFTVAVGIWSLYFVTGLFILNTINISEPSTYIDEIFHAGQCQEYCKGNFSYYDPKITTPPGLYAITLVLLYPLSKVLQTDLCDLIHFRCFNYFISNLNFFIVYQLVNDQMRGSSLVKKFLTSLNLSLLPVLYFFNFFYYTDVVSLSLVLLTCLFYRRNNSLIAGIIGLLSVTVRQTNLIWFCCFAFMKCCEVVDILAAKNGRSISRATKQKISYLVIIVQESMYQLRYSFKHFVICILKETHFFMFSTLIFLYLLMKNGSLVLGDKSAHQAVIHIPQLFYFSLFTCIFSFPCAISTFISFLKYFRQRKFRIFVFTSIVSVIVTFNTMAHLYLISDNRHYTFYIWKRILEKFFLRYFLVPPYVVSMYTISKNISHVNMCTKFAYLASTVICLIPQKLLEFRYFIIPYFMYRIETCQKLTYWQLMLELIFNLVVNYSTINLFLNNPFLWPDGTTQRFSW